MSTPQRPPFDAANDLLAETPAYIDGAIVQMPQGQRLALTFRTSSATLTVMLTKADGAAWAKLIADSAAQMSGSGLLVSPG